MSARMLPTPVARANRPASLARVIDALLGPSERIGDVGQRRRARWLAGLLVLMIAAFGTLDVYYLITRPGYLPPWYGYVLLATSYALVRSGRYLAGALVVSAMNPLVVFMLVASGRSASPLTTLSFLVLGIMLASVILPLGAVIALALLDAFGIVVLALVGRPAPGGLETLVGPLVLVSIAGGIASVGAMLRDRIERDRREALVQANAELEDRVLERTRELERANDELEAFAYSASHDLRTPLRAIDSYAALLAESAAARLDGSDLERLKKVRAGARRMTELVDGMLELSKVSRATVRLEQLDLAVLARDVVQELRTAEPDHEVTFVCPERLLVEGDRTLVRMALSNLIHNSWKFTRGRESPRVELGQERQAAAGLCYFVKDNGIGFEPELVDKVFEPFQRLHSSDHPGTGIGTTIVARAIERQGGRVWADGEPGRGAVFRFTLGVR